MSLVFLQPLQEKCRVVKDSEEDRMDGKISNNYQYIWNSWYSIIQTTKCWPIITDTVTTLKFYMGKFRLVLTTTYMTISIWWLVNHKTKYFLFVKCFVFHKSILNRSNHLNSGRVKFHNYIYLDLENLISFQSFGLQIMINTINY